MQNEIIIIYVRIFEAAKYPPSSSCSWDHKLLGAGSLLAPYPAPRASRASGQPLWHTHRDPELLRVGGFSWPPRTAAKSEVDFKLQGCACRDARPLSSGAGTGKGFPRGGLSPTPASSSTGWLLGHSHCQCVLINQDFSPPLGNSTIVKPKNAAVGGSLPKLGFSPFNLFLV